MKLPPKPGDCVLTPFNIIATVVKVEGKTVEIVWRDTNIQWVSHRDKFHYRDLRKVHGVDKKAG